MNQNIPKSLRVAGFNDLLSLKTVHKKNPGKPGLIHLIA